MDLKLKVEEALKKESNLLTIEEAVLVDKTTQTEMEMLGKGIETEVTDIADCDNTPQGKEVSKEKEIIMVTEIEDLEAQVVSGSKEL